MSTPIAVGAAKEILRDVPLDMKYVWGGKTTRVRGLKSSSQDRDQTEVRQTNGTVAGSCELTRWPRYPVQVAAWGFAGGGPSGAGGIRDLNRVIPDIPRAGSRRFRDAHPLDCR